MTLKLLVCILFALDATTTIYALKATALQEMNAPLRWLIARIGVFGAIVLTHVPLVAVFYFLPLPDWAMWAGFLVGAYAVANNAWLLWKHRGK